jgi:hypothetical protein
MSRWRHRSAPAVDAKLYGFPIPDDDGGDDDVFEHVADESAEYVAGLAAGEVRGAL